MIPVRLTLQGIYSYQAKQTIDFTHLTHSGIFGIFGTVGSGKSTILEAITFALYGKTDRLNLSGDNRNYNMMNLKSNELFIEFLFRSGINDTLFMVSVKGRRNSKQFDDVKTLERLAYRQDQETWIPFQTEDLESVIGLSYENFKRTIIIPQGRFQEFLQLSDKDRTQMMKELFNLEKYEFFYKVVSLESSNEREKQLCMGNLQQLGDSPPEQITTIQNLIDHLIDTISQQNSAMETLQQELGQQQKVKEMTEKLDDLTKMLALLKEQESQIILAEDRIRKFEYCSLNFKNLFESLTEVSHKISGLEKAIKQDELLKSMLFQDLNSLQPLFDTIRNDYENRDLLKQQAGELEKIIELRVLKNESEALEIRITNGEKSIETLVTKIDENSAQQEKSQTSIKEKKLQVPDFSMLAAVKNWHTVKNHLVVEYQNISREHEAAQKEMDGLASQKNKLCISPYIPGSDHSHEIEDPGAVLENQRQLRAKKLEDLNIDMTHLQLQSHMEEYAASLEDGKPCPLCGSTDHPMVANFTQVANSLQQTKIQRSNLEFDLKEIDLLQKKLAALETTMLIKNDQFQKYNASHLEIQLKLDNHQRSFLWNKYHTEEDISNAFTEAEKLHNQIIQHEKDLEYIGKLSVEINNQKNRYREEIEKIKHQYTASIARNKTLVELFELYQPEHFSTYLQDDIQREKDLKLKKIISVEKEYTEIQVKLKNLQADTDILTGKLEVNGISLQQEILRLLSVEEKIQHQLLQSEYKSLEEIKEILHVPMDVDKEKLMLVAYHQQVNVAEHQKKVLTETLSGRIYDSQQHLQLLDQQTQQNNSLTIHHQELGKTKNELQKLMINEDKRQELLKKLAVLESRADNIKTLKQLFKASGFVNYISSVYLQELCHVANVRFSKLTRQKLSLEVTEDNNFQVRDFMNGGRIRSVKTLSGGQTFQAALALALALADNIQKITTARQNFFFLDEGFGSLDKESLEIVFDTLKTLRKEHRIVGIISHVEEMQQEIENHLKIINDEELGSLVETH